MIQIQGCIKERLLKNKGIVMNTSPEILIHIESSVQAIAHYSKGEYRSILFAMLQATHSMYTVELQLVSDATISTHNMRFNTIFAPTNILSFEAQEHDNTSILILSLHTTKRESVLYAQKYSQYIIYLLAHGFVHSLGYNHGEEMDVLTDICYTSALQHMSITT